MKARPNKYFPDDMLKRRLEQAYPQLVPLKGATLEAMSDLLSLLQQTLEFLSEPVQEGNLHDIYISQIPRTERERLEYDNDRLKRKQDLERNILALLMPPS